jgi:drug/metabolite transporter (DMT)-like permease
MLVGGLFELVGSFMVLASFHKAILAEMNPGISNSIVAIHGVFILVLNWLIYKDPIRNAQWLAILIIVTSILLLSFYFDYSSKEFYEVFH